MRPKKASPRVANTPVFMPTGIGSIIGCGNLMKQRCGLRGLSVACQAGFFNAFFSPPAVMPTRSTASPNSTAEIEPLNHTRTMYNKIPVNKSLMFVRRRRAKRLLLLQPAEITLGTNFSKAKKIPCGEQCSEAKPEDPRPRRVKRPEHRAEKQGQGNDAELPAQDFPDHGVLHAAPPQPLLQPVERAVIFAAFCLHRPVPLGGAVCACPARCCGIPRRCPR